MSKRIIYQDNNGYVFVINPIEDCGMTIEQIASKDVPTGTKYRIVEVSDIPIDRTFRDAWEADFTTHDGIGGA